MTTKDIISALTISVSLISVTAESRATLLSSESFQVGSGSYTSGTSFTGVNTAITTGNFGFDTTQQWQRGTGAILVTNSVSLSHSGLNGSAQTGSVQIQQFNSGGAISRNSLRNLANLPSTQSSYFLSTLVRGNTLSSMSSGSAISVGFASNAATTNAFDSSIGFHIGLSNVGGTNYLAAFAGASQYNLLALDSNTIDDTFQIVAQLNVNASGNETLSVWYAANGDANLTVAMSAVDIGSSTWASVFDSRALVLQTRNTTGTTTQTAGYIDEVRFGTSLVDVTTLSTIPEPSSATWLLGLMAGAYCLLRRRRAS